MAVRAVGTTVAPLREALTTQVPLKKDNQHSLQFRRAPPSPAALPSRAALQSQPVSLPLALSPPPISTAIAKKRMYIGFFAQFLI